MLHEFLEKMLVTAAGQWLSVDALSRPDGPACAIKRSKTSLKHDDLEGRFILHEDLTRLT